MFLQGIKRNPAESGAIPFNRFGARFGAYHFSVCLGQRDLAALAADLTVDHFADAGTATFADAEATIVLSTIVFANPDSWTTILPSLGVIEEARSTAQQALKLDPDIAATMTLLQQLGAW